nr:type 1 glutamine amidotransferase [Bacteriovorax sp. HI3]
MRKVLVFQHVAHTILGTLNPTLKSRGLNIRYVNFERTPDEQPSVQKYNGLIVLGGHMGVYEADKYRHIKVEMQLIEEALKKEIPILGICLGAQLLAHVLGAEVRKSAEKEIGWCDVNLTEEGTQDPLFSHFKKTEKIFQLHGDTFDIPRGATHLASSDICPGQAFKYGDKAYGIQFHLEADQAMIMRWLDNPRNQEEMFKTHSPFSAETIRTETEKYIAHSTDLSQKTFNNFINLFSLKERPVRLGSR